MRLIYKATGTEVKIGDVVNREDCLMTVRGIHKPHKPSSPGRVYVTWNDGAAEIEYFPSVIGAEWIEREDQV